MAAPEPHASRTCKRAAGMQRQWSAEDEDEEEVPEAVPIEQPPQQPQEEEHRIEDAAPQATQEQCAAAPVPLTILTGWLGAGKTTLLQRIIEDAANTSRSVAVVQNEFSDSGVEAAQVADDSGNVFDNFIELANGCICCTVRNDFVTALETLVRMKRFDLIVLECSGLADPGSLASIFWVDEELEIGVRLDGIIALVDAKNVLSNTLSHSPEASSVRRQIAYADRIVLNKLDLVEAVDLPRIFDLIRTFNVSAPVLEARFAEVALTDIIGIDAFSVASLADGLVASCCSSRSSSCVHDSSISTVVLGPFTEQKGIELARFERWLAALLWDESETAPTVFRLKGLLHVQGSADKCYVQAVQKLYETTWHQPWAELEQRVTKLVIIGRELDPTRLEHSFRLACFDNASYQ